MNAVYRIRLQGRGRAEGAMNKGKRNDTVQ